jgi:hypothetical protein
LPKESLPIIFEDFKKLYLRFKFLEMLNGLQKWIGKKTIDGLPL